MISSNLDLTKILILNCRISLMSAGELAGGSRTQPCLVMRKEVFEETPSTAQPATLRGVGREPWLQNRNGTSTWPVTLRRAKSPSRLCGNGETAVLRGGRANRRQ
jgi:hypothetical protein